MTDDLICISWAKKKMDKMLNLKHKQIKKPSMKWKIKTFKGHVEYGLLNPYKENVVVKQPQHIKKKIHWQRFHFPSYSFNWFYKRHRYSQQIGQDWIWNGKTNKNRKQIKSDCYNISIVKQKAPQHSIGF